MEENVEELQETAIAQTPQERCIAYHKAFVDYYSKHPTAPANNMFDYDYEKSDYIWIDGKPEEYKAIGSGDKRYTDEYFYFTVTLIPGSLELRFITPRGNVCKKIVKGKKIVPEYTVEGTPSRVIPEHEEDDFEWECPESILAPAEE